jgi:hypothetical protein
MGAPQQQLGHNDVGGGGQLDGQAGSSSQEAQVPN